MNRNSNLAIIVILAIIVALVIAFIVTANDDGNNGDTNNNTEITNNDDRNNDQDDELDTVDSLNEVLNEDSADDVEDVSYTIDMDHLSFSPSTISAKPGQTVNLTLTSSDEIHDFVLDAFDANSGLVSAGGEKKYSFTIPANAEAGSYEFYCSVGSHRQLGMVGTLVVAL